MEKLQRDHMQVSSDDETWEPASQARLASPHTFGRIPSASVKPESYSFSWGRELTSLTLSVLVVSALIVLLLFVEDEPYYETWNFVVSLPTVLAILTTTYKTAQLHAVAAAIGQVKWINFQKKSQRLRNFEIYDESSRGPQGAIKLLVTVRWGLATVGAIVTLLALANDPFTQQVVQLIPRNQTTADSNAKFGFALEYNTSPAQGSESSLQSPEVSTRDRGLQGAVMKGIFNIQTPEEFVCGGACLWNATYRSLGFASSCEDVTRATMESKVCGKAADGATTVCNYTTPGDVSFASETVETDSATALRVAVNDTFYPYLTPSYHQLSPAFLKVAVYRPVIENYWEVVNNSVTECTLSLAVHEYSGISANGSQLHIGNEKTIDLAPGHFTNGVPLPTTTSLTNLSFTFNQSEAGPLDPPMRLGLFDFANTITFFESNAFESHIISGYTVNKPDTGIGAAFLHADIPDIFASLAKSMTDYLRSLSSGPNAQSATGYSVQQVVYVHVRWEWLALPILQEALASAFVLFVIVHNRMLGVPAWKTSALAVLLHVFDQSDNSIETEFAGPNAVKEASKRYQAQLKH